MATLRLNRDKEAFELSMHAVLSVLKPGAALWIYGANDEGMKSLPRRLSELVGDVELMDLRKRCRVIRLERPAELSGLRAGLEDWARADEMSLPSGTRPWKSYPGVFAKGGLDPATAALLEALPPIEPRSRVLDFASGPGTIAAELRAREPSLQLALLDHDALALSAARENLPRASYLQSDSWHRPPGRHRWDIIVSNPPIHRGRAQELSVLEDLVSGAPLRLTRGGSLWFICLSHLPIRPVIDQAFGEDSEIAFKDGRFTVWHCTREA
jgi:16S rRNA (guanine1207-N2)-methyltransferase